MCPLDVPIRGRVVTGLGSYAILCAFAALTNAYGRSQPAHKHTGASISNLIGPFAGPLGREHSRFFKLILADAGLSEVLATVSRLIEAQRPGMICSIFLLERDGLRLR